MPDRAKGSGQVKCSPCLGLRTPARGKNYCYETMEEAKTHRGCCANMNENILNTKFNNV
jgi:hypothetical protein